MKYDVAVIGGGAAGLCAAICLKRSAPSLSVTVLEQLPRVGKKLITTGNGRCNITNRNPALIRFHSGNPDFAGFALKRYDNKAVEDFFKSIGIVITYDEIGRAYPYSLQAASVVDMLRFACDELSVQTLTDTKVTDIKKTQNGFILTTDNDNIQARVVLVAAGLYSGGEKLGSDGKILRIMRDKLGYKVVKTTPAIVQLKTPPQSVRSLKGMKVNANAALYNNGKLVREEYGEVLFCDYGLSGPPIMQLSRAVERSSGKFTVNLDIMPDYDFSALCDLLESRVNVLGKRTLGEFFTGMLNKRVGQYILKGCGFALSDDVLSVRKDIKRIASAIKQMQFEITGTTGFINSQVTAGGLDTHGFDNKTMMSLKHKGLFAAGEILDIDGDCGGFNLQWAWASAMSAADGICKYLGVK